MPWAWESLVGSGFTLKDAPVSEMITVLFGRTRVVVAVQLLMENHVQRTNVVDFHPEDERDKWFIRSTTFLLTAKRFQKVSQSDIVIVGSFWRSVQWFH
ncbi:hypothetical protein PAAG_02400 [Paracoccidioides lutzii Pb01]|uniref:Uncharacterized protein n=1 Tax=Paracoccidioides lutzii (strain ATCC MYA-826 / Pb01) TaxID=502779 RepID=C1GUS7_PARBA|nr:hypothetical protein PAAG_02400 [Paracoccidioides lutzii Pb01]EEH40345.2 hypothetical protein PAAG_02400 [Paracoccidioides lutzii Pb01]